METSARDMVNIEETFARELPVPLDSHLSQHLPLGEAGKYEEVEM